MQIIDISCRWPGSSHDATMFANSVLCDKFDRGKFGTDSVILADSAYGPNYYICKPLQNPVSVAEKRYQKAQIKTRNIVERTFGILKRKFPCLAIGMHFRLNKVQDIIVSCCILHNLIRSENHNIIVPPIENHEIEMQTEISRRLVIAQQNSRQLRTQNFLINEHFPL